MQFPFRKKFIMPIYDNSGNTRKLLGKFSFKEPFAIDVLQFANNIDSTKIIKRISKKIKHNFHVEYPDFIPINFKEKILWRYYHKQKRKLFKKYAMETIYSNIDKIANILVKVYLRRKDSIFNRTWKYEVRWISENIEGKKSWYACWC